MAEKFDGASQAVSPRDAQKGGQGALDQAHPEIDLKQDAPPASGAPIEAGAVSEGLTLDQIALLCDVSERNASKRTQDHGQDVAQLVSKGFMEPLDEAGALAEHVGPRYRLTLKGTDLLSKRGVADSG